LSNGLDIFLCKQARKFAAGRGRADSGSGPLLADGPVQQAPGEVEMAMLPAHDGADLAAELAAVATAPPRPVTMKRSNSIVF